MPIRKLRLNQAEQARHLTFVRELHAAGVDIEIPEALLENSRAVDITLGRGPASWVFDWSGVVFYVIWVRLIALRPCTLLHCWMSTKWDGYIELQSLEHERPLCKLGPLVYAQAEVLNLRLENGLRFSRRGEVVEGIILAHALRPIPEKYLDGAIVPFQLTFEDEFGAEIKEAATLLVDRTARTMPGPQERGTGLYGPSRSGEPARLAAGGQLRKTKRQPPVAGYGDDALSLLKYRETREKTAADKG